MDITTGRGATFARGGKEGEKKLSIIHNTPQGESNAHVVDGVSPGPW